MVGAGIAGVVFVYIEAIVASLAVLARARARQAVRIANPAYKQYVLEEAISALATGAVVERENVREGARSTLCSLFRAGQTAVQAFVAQTCMTIDEEVARACRAGVVVGR